MARDIFRVPSWSDRRIRHLPPSAGMGGSQFTMTLCLWMGYAQTPEIENGGGPNCHFSWFVHTVSHPQGHGELGCPPFPLLSTYICVVQSKKVPV